MRVEEFGHADDQGLLPLIPLAHLRPKPLLIPHEVDMRTVPENEGVLLVIRVTPQSVGAGWRDVTTLQRRLRYRYRVSQFRVLLDVVDVLAGCSQEGDTVYVSFVRVRYALKRGVLRCLSVVL